MFPGFESLPLRQSTRLTRKAVEEFDADRNGYYVWNSGGDVAQLGEHYVRNVGVGGSNPLISTIDFLRDAQVAQ